MNNRKYLFLEQYSKLSSVIGSITFALLILTTGLVTNDAYANFESTESSTVAACPANHKMYYIGANPPNSTQIFPVANPPQELSWTSGSTTKTFTFEENSGNKTFTISFSGILDKTTTTISNPPNAESPFYGSLTGVTTSAINLVHSSPISNVSKTNHNVNITVNRPTSKTGYKIQDVDSVTIDTTTPYIEQIDASASNGKLTYNSLFHTINSSGNIVTGKKGLNCGTGECTIDANWNYTLADIALNLKHNNTLSEINSPHAVGYSDFYFCLAPPKLIVKKALNGTRVKTNDQFEIVVSGGSIATNSFTTTGTGSTITNGTSATLSLVESTSYTITERVMNGSTLGDIANYNATYTCTNATTGSTTVMPTTAMTYNAIAKTRSFTLANATFGDEITCTITNTPKSYTFTGFVFNDNGGITASDSTKQNISTTFTSNANYFNGIFDSSGSNKESGIGASGLQVRLTNCGPNGGTDISGTSAQNISASASPGLLLGQYRFTVPASVIAILSPQKVCVMQVEPGSWKDSTNVSDYSVDTTPNTREVALVANTFDYKTESNGSRDLDFGEVQANNASLVLVKSQYVHNCNINTNFNGTTGTPSQTPVFSIAEIKDIEPGKCIAYRIEAYNRGHVDLKDIQINDQLQVKSQTNLVTSVFALPVPKGDPTSLYTGTTLPTGTITSELFNLNKPTGSTPTKAALYFNTKYGTTMDTQ